MYVSFFGVVEASRIGINDIYDVMESWDNVWIQDPSNGQLEVWAMPSRDGINIHFAVGIPGDWCESGTTTINEFDNFFGELWEGRDE